MKNIFFSAMSLAILTLILSACDIAEYGWGQPTPPITNNVNIIMPAVSETFEYEEIIAAFDTVINNFTYPGCELLDIWYDEINNDKEVKIRDVDKRNCIIILSNFYVNPKGAPMSFNADFTYPDWYWILVREDEDSPWEIKDCGVF